MSGSRSSPVSETVTVGRWRMEFVFIRGPLRVDGLLNLADISVLSETPPELSTNAKIVDLGVLTGLMSGFGRQKKGSLGSRRSGITGR